MSLVLGRRRLLGAAGGGLVVVTAGGCKPQPKTPLAHLYGERWVHGAYEMYAQGYQKVEQQSEDQSFGAYRVLAQRGVSALDGLQLREVPFYIRVTEDERAFKIERKVPERLMFTADMNDADRTAATAAWEKAREHIHTDYDEVRKLDDALSTLLRQQQRVRLAIDRGHEEQFRLVRQLRALDQNQTPPFPLPYQVTPADYRQVLALLLDRLEEDSGSLGRIESSIVATGLVVRATDANSGSLAANLRQVLVAIDEDAAAADRRAVTSPTGDERAKRIDHGQSLATTIEGTQDYKLWLRREQSQGFEAIGSVLTILDSVTHLPISSVYRQVLEVWRSDGDYLDYLKVALALAPGGTHLSSALGKGVELTGKARSVVAQGSALVDKVQKGAAVVDKVKKGVATADRVQKAVADGTAADRAAALLQQQGAGVLNTASRYAEKRLDRQLAFFTSQAELDQVTERLAASSLLRVTATP